MADLEFLIGKEGEEIKKVADLLSRAEEAEDICEASKPLREVKEIIRNSEQRGIYDSLIIQEVLARKFIEQAEVTLPAKEFEESLEKAIFTYQEALNGLMDKEEIKRRCLEKVRGACYERINNILGALGQGRLDRRLVGRYESLKNKIKESEGEKKIIKIRLNGKEKGSDEVFYGLMLQNMVNHLGAGNFNLTKIGNCEALRKDYHEWRERLEEIKGSPPLWVSKEGEALMDEVFYVNLTGYLTNWARQLAKKEKYHKEKEGIKKEEGEEDEISAEEVLEYRNQVLGKAQDYLYEKIEEAGENYQRAEGEEEKKKKEGILDTLMGGYTRFTANFSEILEESKEEAEQVMKELKEKYSRPLMKTGNIVIEYTKE